MPRTLLKGIATLALAMTGCFIVFASMSSEQTPGRVEVYEVYAPRFFEGIAAVATLLRNDN